MNYVVVSYYTKNTIYEKDAKLLRDSCIRLNLLHDIQPISNLGEWEKNCCHKALFLQKMFKKHKRDLVWTDADSFFINHPLFFDNPNYDLAIKVYSQLPNESEHKIVSNTIYLKNKPSIKNLLKDWHSGCNKKGVVLDQLVLRDQQVLKDLLLLNKHKINYVALPFSHCKVFDSEIDNEYDSKDVIIHTQASRSTTFSENHNVSLDLLNNTDLVSSWQIRDVFNYGIDSLLAAKKTIEEGLKALD